MVIILEKCYRYKEKEIKKEFSFDDTTTTL